MQDARYNIKQRESYSKCQIMPRPDYTMCHSMQNASLCNIWNYPKCKLTQGVKLCKIKKFMQNAKPITVQRMQISNICERPKLWKVQNYAKYKTKQCAYICKMQNLHAFLNGVARTPKMLLHALLKWCCANF